MSLINAFKKNKAKDPEKTAVVVTKPSAKMITHKNIVPSIERVLLRRPWTSEKAHILGKYNQYIFLVAPEANKPLIKKEVAHRYGVKVKTINMITQKGKLKRLGRQMGRRSNFKKAIVTLTAGQKIEIT